MAGASLHAIALPKGTLSALVERAACDAIQNCLARHKAEATRNNKTPENALLRNGYARCVYCGLVMHVQIRTRQAPVSMCGGA